MRLRAIRADVTYALRAWVRTRASLVVSLLFPLILLVTFGFIFGAPPSPPVLLYEDRDGSATSEAVFADLAARPTLRVRNASAPDGDLAPWLAAEGAVGYLRVPEGFGDGAADARPLVVTDGKDPYVADLVRAAAESAVARAAGAAPAETRTVETAPPVPYTSYLLPGVVGLNVLSVGLFTSFGYVAQLRAQGLLGRLAVSPMTKSEWIVGRMVGQAIVSVLITAFLVVVAALLFGTPLVPGPLTLVIVVVGTMVFSGLGTLVGGLVKNLGTGSTIITIVYFPMLVLSGAFFDTSLLPAAIRWLPKAVPLTYLNNALRKDMILRDSAGALVDILALALFAALLVGLGARLIDWTERET